jgi:hypothetical protein
MSRAVAVLPTLVSFEHDDGIRGVRGLARRACYGRYMSNSRSNTGTVDVDGVTYEWHLEREPQWSDADGWKGMVVSLLEKDTKREALLEFPTPKRLLKGLPRGRLQIDDPTLSRGVRAALAAGWEPMSRGKPMIFTVDAEGN